MKSIFFNVTILLVSAAVSYIAFTLGTSYLRGTAIDGCAIASRNTYTEQGDNFIRVVEEPDRNAYKACLDLKNIK